MASGRKLEGIKHGGGIFGKAGFGGCIGQRLILRTFPIQLVDFLGPGRVKLRQFDPTVERSVICLPSNKGRIKGFWAKDIFSPLKIC